MSNNFTFIGDFAYSQKKVKISNVKRSQHIKHKKNYARPQKNAVKAKGKSASEKATVVSKKVFGKPVGQKTKKRDRGQEKKQLYTSTPAPAAEPVNNTNGDADEMDDDDVQDMLDMLHDDDNNRDEFVSGIGNGEMSTLSASRILIDCLFI